MRVLFARHGKTNTNLEKVIAGHLQAQLTPEGIEQAKQLGEALKNVKIDAAYISPLDRAQQTFHTAFPSPSFPFYTESLLIERNFGSLEGKKNDGDYYGWWRTQHQDEVDGETIQDVAIRWGDFIDKLKATYGDADVTILVVAHAGLGCVARAYFEGEPASGNYLEVEPIKNGGYAEWGI